MNCCFKIKFSIFDLFLHIPNVTNQLSFLCIFKVHLQNQSNSGNYMTRYWSTVDGMWCYIYYHLDFSKRCWRETLNRTFQLLKIFLSWLSRVSIISSSVTYLICFTVGISHFIRAWPEMLSHVFCCKFGQDVFKITSKTEVGSRI